MSAVLPFPAYPVRHQLERERLAWMKEAARLFAKDLVSEYRYCQGRASGLDQAVLALGGQGISMCIGDYVDAPEADSSRPTA